MGSLEEQIAAVAYDAAARGVRDALDEAGGGPLLVSVAEAAELLSVSDDYIYDHLIPSGQLETMKLGRGIKITVASLRAFVEDNVDRTLKAVS